MRKVTALDESTGSTNCQDDEPCSYRETLECRRYDYERIDIKQKPVVKSAEPMAEISWTTADVMRRASDTAFALEAHRRGMVLVGAKNILSGKYHDSGKRKHRRKNKSQRGN